MIGGGIRRLMAGGAAALMLQAACTVPVVPPDATVAPDVAALQRSSESQAVLAYYQRIERSLMARGLLRRDGGARNGALTAEQLAANFRKIAFYDELVADGGSLVSRETANRLRRWDVPVRIKVDFGASVPYPQRARCGFGRGLCRAAVGGDGSPDPGGARRGEFPGADRQR